MSYKGKEHGLLLSIIPLDQTNGHQILLEIACNHSNHQFESVPLPSGQDQMPSFLVQHKVFFYRTNIDQLLDVNRFV